MRNRYWAMLLFGVGTAVCSAAGPQEAPPPAVVVDSVKMVAAKTPTRYVGVVETISHVDVMPRITGTLLKMHFKEGELVKAGDLLYELEDTQYRTAVESLKAQREQLVAALQYADAEFQRNDRLLHSKAVSVSTHDKAVLEINSARAKIKDLDASLENAQNTFSYTRIHAPISGRIGKSEFTVGNLITPQVGKLTDIESVSPIYVRFSLSERVFRRNFGGRDKIAARAAIQLILADGTPFNEPAKIALIDNKITASTNAITIWAEFENRGHQLIAGGFATVLLAEKMDKPLPAVLPSALTVDDKGYHVCVLDAENRVAIRPVQCGGFSDGLQIIVSGLDGSERIITEGMHKVRPGDRVNAVPANAR